MIRQAERRLADLESIEAHFQQRELTADQWDLGLVERPADLVVLFGVLHHIPGLESRRRLLERLSHLLAPSGFMILSFWQFGGQERFRRRILDWSAYSRLGSVTVDEGQLEPGDYLLAWGNLDPAGPQGEIASGARRYCHYADPDEAFEWTRSLGLPILDRFEADGGGSLNLYFVLRKTGA